MKERGSALLTAVIIVMVLLSISGIFFTTLVYQGKNESSEERGLKAYYLAEAGVQYGIAAIWNGDLADGSSYEKTRKNPFGQGEKFVVTVTQEDESHYIVESTGYYGADTERRIKVSYKYVEGGGGSGGDGGGDEEVAEKYPAWESHVYSDPGALVNSRNDEGYLKVFYNIWYAHPGDAPGSAPQWQEITTRWTAYNRYWEDDIITYDNRKFLHRWGGPNTNGVPGSLTNEWQELTNEWRNFNTYKTGDIVIYNSKLYRARDDGAYNEVPGLADSSWQELTTEWRAFNEYDLKKSEVYNEVTYVGKRYQAKWYSKNHLPGFADVWQLIPNDQITPPVLLGVMVSPAVASIKVGETKALFTVKEIYSDGSTIDVTNTAVWSSSNPGKAIMSDGGVATGVASGYFTGYYGDGKVFIPIETPTPIPLPVTIPITATSHGKVGTGYVTVSVPTTIGSGTAAEGFLWEMEMD